MSKKQVPSCDLFEMKTLPSLGNGLDINYILDRDGCYLGLIQRKVGILFYNTLKTTFYLPFSCTDVFTAQILLC